MCGRWMRGASAGAGRLHPQNIKVPTVQHARQEFETLRRRGKITAKPTWRLPATNAPTAIAALYDRRLYEDEWSTAWKKGPSGPSAGSTT